MNNSAQQTDARQQEGVEPGKTEASPATFPGDHVPEEEAGGTNETMDRKGDIVKALYRVKSKRNNMYNGYHDRWYDDVTISWLCQGRPYPLVHPEEAIRDYHKLDGPKNALAEGCKIAALEALGQLFLQEEARALKDYLSRFKLVTKTDITKVALPFSATDYHTLSDVLVEFSDDAGLTLPAGWDEDALPFKVAGFYDVDGAVEREPPAPPVCPTCGQEIKKVQDALNDDDIPDPYERSGNSRHALRREFIETTTNTIEPRKYRYRGCEHRVRCRGTSPGGCFRLLRREPSPAVSRRCHADP